MYAGVLFSSIFNVLILERHNHELKSTQHSNYRQLIRNVVRGTQDEAKWTAEAKVLVSFSICHFLCQSLFELDDELKLYATIHASAKQETKKLSMTYEIEGRSHQFLHDFWIVYDGRYSDKEGVLSNLGASLISGRWATINGKFQKARGQICCGRFLALRSCF